MEQGRNSYYIASTFDYGEYRKEARVLRQMSHEFDLCVFALHRVREEMDRMGVSEMTSARTAMLE
jgi:hypothetical protein